MSDLLPGDPLVAHYADLVVHIEALILSRAPWPQSRWFPVPVPGALRPAEVLELAEKLADGARLAARQEIGP